MNVPRRICLLFFVIIFLFISFTFAAQDEKAVQRAQSTAAQIDSLSVSDDGMIKVFYDYIEDGVLAGGRAMLPKPSLSVPMLPEQLTSYPSYTLISNGPSDNRIDLVFVGDGYTAGEMDIYWQHVETIISNFFEGMPLAEYADFFNVHVVEVVSNESGVDEPDNGIYRDTALDMRFNCNNIPRLLCIDYTKAWSAASNAADTDLVIAIANTTRYGGAGYTDLSTVSGNNSSAVEVVLHEFGHSFAGLADEYHYGDGTYYTGSERPEANISIYTAPQQAVGNYKWYRWLDLPQVDSFEGAYYKEYGIYRPTYSSKMQALGQSFGPVNSEQFVFSIYKETTPIDQVNPGLDGVKSSGTIFTVEGPLPIPDTCTISWLIDSVPVTGANQSSFCPADYISYLTPNTLQTLTVSVTDETDMVRDETQRSNIMTDQRSWQIWHASADVVTDGIVDIDDLLAIVANWLSSNSAYDIAPAGGDNFVDMQDLAILAAQWMQPS